jgi:hypothetical protein
VIQVTPQMRILVAVAPVDLRCGIDGLARVCTAVLTTDPCSGTVFVFRNRRGTAIKRLTYDTQGFWLAQKGLGECAVPALRTVGREFKLYLGLPDFFDRLEEVERISTYALADKKLQTLGESPRFFLHLDNGQPP